MSNIIHGKMISTWSDEELIQELDQMACVSNIGIYFAVLAESASRSLQYANKAEAQLAQAKEGE